MLSKAGELRNDLDHSLKHERVMMEMKMKMKPHADIIIVELRT